MRSNTVDQIINDAITTYIEYFTDNRKEQTSAINSALGSQKLPSKLTKILKEGLKNQAATEELDLFNNLYKEQKAANANYLSRIPLDQIKKNQEQVINDLQDVIKQIKKENAQLLQFNTIFNTGVADSDCIVRAKELYNRYAGSGHQIELRNYFQKEINAAPSEYQASLNNILETIFYVQDRYTWLFSSGAQQSIANLLYKLACIRQINNSNQLIEKYKTEQTKIEADVDNYTQVLSVYEMPSKSDSDSSKLLSEYNERYNKGMKSIQTTYDYNQLTKQHFDAMYDTFINALTPQIKNEPKFKDALEQFDHAVAKRTDLEQKKSSIINILDAKITALEARARNNIAPVKNRDKARRVTELKQDIASYETTFTANVYALEQVIHDWEKQYGYGVMNADAFRPTTGCCFFKSKDDSGFIQECVNTLQTKVVNQQAVVAP